VPKTSAALRAEQDEAFLAALRRTGNARLAACELGVHRSTYTKRRARDSAFAARWNAELAACHARRARVGGIRRPEGSAFRTRGGEPDVVRTRGRRLQRRLAPPGRLTAAAERAVLDVVEATNNRPPFRPAKCGSNLRDGHTQFHRRIRLPFIKCHERACRRSRHGKVKDVTGAETRRLPGCARGRGFEVGLLDRQENQALAPASPLRGGVRALLERELTHADLQGKGAGNFGCLPMR
jgi:hypothetical protein